MGQSGAMPNPSTPQARAGASAALATPVLASSREVARATAPPGAVSAPARLAAPGLAGVVPTELASWLVARGERAFRTRQILDGVWRSPATGTSGISTLPPVLRDALDATFRWDTIVSTDRTAADGGATEKFLHRLVDGAVVESVLMHVPPGPDRRERHTLCISSQAGCAVGCPFCATGELGFTRDLLTAEILDQVRAAARHLAASRTVGRSPRPVSEVDRRHLTNVVFMGMGEPLLNLDHVLEAIEALNDPARFGLGARHITVSTSGVVPGIRRLTEIGAQFSLAISLHAARGPLRDVLVPLNRRWPVDEVVAAARDHAAATGRRVTYEVVMIGGINDTAADADAMAALLHGDLAHVNLIPMNPVAHTPWHASTPEAIERFAARLRAAGLPVTIRRNRGQEVGAACGQLAARRAGAPAPSAVAWRRRRLEAASLAAIRGDETEAVEPVLARAATEAGTTP